MEGQKNEHEREAKEKTERWNKVETKVSKA